MGSDKWDKRERELGAAAPREDREASEPTDACEEDPEEDEVSIEESVEDEDMGSSVRRIVRASGARCKYRERRQREKRREW